MSELEDRLKRLREELDALSRIKTQEDYDEGARLHAEKNSPWVSGMYSHLLDAHGRLRGEGPYVHQEYPKAMYTAEFIQARLEAQNARYLSNVTDQQRQEAIKEAERVLGLQTCLVNNEGEERLRAGHGWGVTPEAALALRKATDDEIAVQAAHLAYEDRNLGDKARAEREAADSASEGHLVEVVKRGRPRKDMSVNG